MRKDATTTISSPPHHKVINFIAGGSEVCGPTYSQAKRVAKVAGIRVAKVDVLNDVTSTIQFDDTDREHIVEPQHDSLVISMPIGSCFIKRILVDNGNAANIMMLQTLKEMGLTENDMTKKCTT